MREALAEAAGRPVSRETFRLIEAYVERLRQAAVGHNLVAESTLKSVWSRHILDSAQIVRFEGRNAGSWVDIGSGAGLPGMVIAALVDGPVTLVEPRRLRAEFLRSTIDTLGLAPRVTVTQTKIERVDGQFDAITARAVGALDRLIAMAQHLSGPETVWVLPKGKNAQSELAQARRNWHCAARVEKSCTDPDSDIVVLTKVGAIRKR